MSSYLFRRTAVAAPSAFRAFTTSAPRSSAVISLVGNLGSTPEIKVAADGQEYVRYSVASNSGPKDKRHTSWFNVVAFGENSRDYLTTLPKGSMVHVYGEGRITQSQDSEGKTYNNFSIAQQRLEVLKRGQAAEE